MKKTTLFLFLLILFFNSFSQWKLNYFVDDFKDKTNEKYISQTDYNGLFSNSVTKYSKLHTKVIIYFINEQLIIPNVKFYLHEYGSDQSTTNINNKSLKLKIKYDNNIKEFDVNLLNNSFVLSSNDEILEFVDILIGQSKPIKCNLLIHQGSLSSDYNFSINPIGFKKQYDLIKHSEYDSLFSIYKKSLVNSNTTTKKTTTPNTTETTKTNTTKVSTPKTPLQENGTIKWLTFEEAVKLNQTNPGQFFIDFYTDWCGWCKVLDSKTFQDPFVAKYMSENFYCVKFNAEQKPDINFMNKTWKWVAGGRNGYHELAAYFMQGQMSYPTCVVLTSKYELVYPLKGYVKVEEFEPLITFFGKELYTSPSNNYETYKSTYKRQ